MEEHIVSPYECAVLSSYVYRPEMDDQIWNGWRRLSASKINNYGYRGVAYVHHEKKAIVIAHRGTKPESFFNLVSDAAIFAEIPFEARELALQFSQTVRTLEAKGEERYTIYETGHSLGGYTAIYCAVKNEGASITFDAPGFDEAFAAEVAPAQGERMIEYCSAPDIVNTVGQHLGRMIRIYPYHVQHEGIQTSGLVNVFNLVLDAGLSIAAPITWLFQKFSQSFGNAVMSQHSLDHIKDCFDGILQEPYLQRSIKGWPNSKQYLSAFKFFLERRVEPIRAVCDTHARPAERNRKMESLVEEIEGYSPGRFMIAAQFEFGREIEKFAYSQQLLGRMDDFYDPEANPHRTRMAMQMKLLSRPRETQRWAYPFAIQQQPEPSHVDMTLFFANPTQAPTAGETVALGSEAQEASGSGLSEAEKHVDVSKLAGGFQ